MLEFILIGTSYAFAAAVQPGPLQAYLLNSVLQKGWKKTLPASLSPLISDIPIALLMLLVLRNITPVLGRVLQGSGGILLLYLALSGYYQWKKKSNKDEEKSENYSGTLIKAITVNLLNPNPYLGWSLVMGPAFLKAWAKASIDAAALIVSFYGTMVIMLALTIIFFGTTSFINEKNKQKLILISLFLLASLGVYQLITACL